MCMCVCVCVCVCVCACVCVDKMFDQKIQGSSVQNTWLVRQSVALLIIVIYSLMFPLVFCFFPLKVQV